MIPTNCSGGQNWEFRKIASIALATNGSDQVGLTFTENLTNGSNFYNNGQVIKVRQYANIDFGAGAYVTCHPWQNWETNNHNPDWEPVVY